MSKLTIHIFSDSFGESGEQVLRCALSQFDIEGYNIVRHIRVSSVEILERELRKIKDYSNIFILFTLVNVEVVKRMKEFCLENQINYSDLLSPLLSVLQKQTGEEPKRRSGAYRIMDEKYFGRIEAIEFAVKYDDGKDQHMLHEADLVLIGISRTSKTPLSIYIANKMYLKVLNIPLVPEVEPPKELFEIPKKKIIGLTNSIEMLNKIRTERVRCIGLRNGSNYSSLARIIEELNYAEKIMKKIGCPIIDVSQKAIEETAQVILEIMKEQEIL
ncbi:pyruvate, water dikinase regulatory protein [Fusobacterium sp.]|uniref:pyruvate, water dikinase regulatory protein n=1 Tax=Fusobacterium sp. TaxID=68766 RepID=UPI002605D31D|nr:pyruvate, water dikinase regulatory protein [Fusobacterium sp.]